MVLSISFLRHSCIRVTAYKAGNFAVRFLYRLYLKNRNALSYA